MSGYSKLLILIAGAVCILFIVTPAYARDPLGVSGFSVMTGDAMIGGVEGNGGIPLQIQFNLVNDNIWPFGS